MKLTIKLTYKEKLFFKNFEKEYFSCKDFKKIERFMELYIQEIVIFETFGIISTDGYIRFTSYGQAILKQIQEEKEIIELETNS